MRTVYLRGINIIPAWKLAHVGHNEADIVYLKCTSCRNSIIVIAGKAQCFYDF